MRRRRRNTTAQRSFLFILLCDGDDNEVSDGCENYYCYEVLFNLVWLVGVYQDDLYLFLFSFFLSFFFLSGLNGILIRFLASSGLGFWSSTMRPTKSIHLALYQIENTAMPVLRSLHSIMILTDSYSLFQLYNNLHTTSYFESINETNLPPEYQVDIPRAFSTLLPIYHTSLSVDPRTYPPLIYSLRTANIT